VPDPVMMNTIHTIALLFEFTMLALYFLLSQTLYDRAMNSARQKADKLSRAKSEFLANVSHEIRTPMNAIVGMSYLAMQSDLNSRQRNQIERVNRAAQSLLGIINDILDFSKIEAGKLTMESIDFSLDDVLDNLADMVGPESEGKDLELLCDIAPDVPTLLVGDPLRLGQVLVNLGNNAVKFTNWRQIKLSITRV
jgi:signal transduction histidine kinase